MKFKTLLNDKKYLTKIYLYITLMTLLVVILFSFISYYSTENAMINNEYKANSKLLYQLKFNIDTVDQMIMNLSFSLYYNHSINALMYNDVDYQQVLNQIGILKNTIVNTNPFIHSICIYNSKLNTYYSTLDNFQGYSDSLSDLTKKHTEIPRMIPIPRKVKYFSSNSSKEEEDVLTYFTYNYIQKDGNTDGAILINESSEWLINNLKVLNQIDEKQLEKVLIIDEDENVIGNSKDNKFNNNLKLVYHRYVDDINNKSEKTKGYFKAKINNSEYLVTFIYVSRAKWVLLKVQPYEMIFENIKSTKDTYILITIVFITLALISSFTISRSIYKPIGNLVRQVRESSTKDGDDSKTKDEILYLNERYKNTIEQLEKHRSSKKDDREIMKTYFVRKLITDFSSISQSETSKLKQEKLLMLEFDKRWIVGLIRIDDYIDFTNKYSDKDQNLYKFAIINVVSEVLSEGFKNDMVDMKNNCIVIILNIENEDSTTFDYLIQLFKKAQDDIENIFQISITISMSESTGNLKELPKRYAEVINYALYRFTFGKSSIITYRIICKNIENGNLSYPVQLEKKLVDEIKAGNLNNIGTVIKSIFVEISKLNYNNVLLSLMNLINTMRLTVEELNHTFLEPMVIDFNLFTRDIFELETLAELEVRMMDLFKSVVNKEDRLEDEKRTAFTEVVKDIIDTNYMDSSMCLQQIASKLGVSSRYLANVFNGITQISVADYINEVRLTKASEWLQSTNLSINEIIIKIGIENESYFYKLFKKRFGITPRNYALIKKIK